MSRGRDEPPVGRDVLARYGIRAPIFEKLRDAQPTGVVWLAQATDVVPDAPGLLCLGIADDLRVARVAEASLRGAVGELVRAIPWYAEARPGVWVAWRTFEGASREVR